MSAAPKTITITLTRQQIADGDDSQVPEVELYWGDTVVYELDADAAQVYHFRALQLLPLPPVLPIDLVAGGVSKIGDILTNLPKPHSLHVTIKDGSDPWTDGKATLYLKRDLLAPVRDPPPFDPAIKNSGKPN